MARRDVGAGLNLAEPCAQVVGVNHAAALGRVDLIRYDPVRDRFVITLWRPGRDDARVELDFALGCRFAETEAIGQAVCLAGTASPSRAARRSGAVLIGDRWERLADREVEVALSEDVELVGFAHRLDAHRGQVQLRCDRGGIEAMFSIDFEGALGNAFVGGLVPGEPIRVEANVPAFVGAGLKAQYWQTLRPAEHSSAIT